MSLLQSRSLTLRLTLWFALLSALVLSLLGWYVMHSQEHHFEEQDLVVLSGKMKQVRHILEKALATPRGETFTSRLDDALIGYNNLVIAVIGPDWRWVRANAELEPPPKLLDHFTATGSEYLVKWTADNGLVWRGISETHISKGGAGSPYTVVIATEISDHEHFMRSFRKNLRVFIALTTIATGLLGWLVVCWGLAPLQSIKRQAKDITANRLHARLPAETMPLELADLTSTLNEMLSRLEESFQRLSDFSSDLAHELRTPVSNLLTQTQVTLSKTRTVEDYRNILASNEEEFERLSRMISDMLFLAKADNQQLIPKRQQLELADEVAELLEFYDALAEEKEIQISAEGDGAILGDRLMLRRAISNLLSNALCYTPAGESVTIRIGKQEDGSVQLTVENTGPCIPDEHLPRLFNRFYRADSAHHRKTEGSGLGLAITCSILSAHGGDVIVSSADGITRFTLLLPSSVE
ncbi:heavy metal sensor histidine kinase [Sedimenticola hydrogenitrophicus]|uniref:heavy metal sensor histidine kinase n=1 Tax=Sedimenticola hydrogenitrophicus TaxID=2967975 RepID=UPI0023B06790|nr:heavy metal sensor histidine kinase [Sedimenticola hydrogenitrophicus]